MAFHRQASLRHNGQWGAWEFLAPASVLDSVRPARARAQGHSLSSFSVAGRLRVHANLSF